MVSLGQARLRPRRDSDTAATGGREPNFLPHAPMMMGPAPRIMILHQKRVG